MLLRILREKYGPVVLLSHIVHPSRQDAEDFATSIFEDDHLVDLYTRVWVQQRDIKTHQNQKKKARKR